MSVLTAIPTTWSQAAADYVAKLGMQADLEAMLEHTRQTVPGLLHLNLVLVPPYDTGVEDSIVIEATRELSARVEKDPTFSAWGRWFVNAFPPEVRRHFTLVILYGPKNGG